MIRINLGPKLDESSHLCKRVCPSVRRSVRRSVGARRILCRVFSLVSQIGAMVLLIAHERIALERCAFAKIEALEKLNCSFYQDDAWDSSEREKCGNPDQR